MISEASFLLLFFFGYDSRVSFDEQQHNDKKCPHDFNNRAE